ncbi:uncharacterized protein LOC133192888 [Saccostrea echinata]|uniref:uncharacterized protein LOC133192888 n=1 Tax=Saccostrea echinata TaxID=191078 RepID=UPI002A821774|nr:uncharacterized protein LOC133192888 [Saccostrea echinata]
MRNITKGLLLLFFDVLFVVLEAQTAHGPYMAAQFGGGFNQPVYNQPYNQQGYNQPYNQPYNQQYNQPYNQPYNQQYNNPGGYTAPPVPTTVATTSTTPGTTVETEFEPEETTIPAITTTTTTTTAKPTPAPPKPRNKRPPQNRGRFSQRQEHQPEPRRNNWMGPSRRYPNMGPPPRRPNQNFRNQKQPPRNYIPPSFQRPLKGQQNFNKPPSKQPIRGQQFRNNAPPMKNQPVTFNQPPYGGPAYNFQQQTRVNTNQYPPPQARPPMQAPMQQQPNRQPLPPQQAMQQRQPFQQQPRITKTASINQKPPVSLNIPPIGTPAPKTVGESCPTYRYTVDNNFVEFHTIPGSCKIQVMYPPGGNGPPKVQFLAKVPLK